MVVPHPPPTFDRPSSSSQVPWTALDPDGKRARLLDAAAAVLARDGLEAPMPAIAAAAGIGIGSVYRQFASKDDLIAALVIERLAWAQRLACDALRSEQPWDALVGALEAMVERQAGDDVVGEAFARASGRPDVAARMVQTTAAFERLLARAREEGTLRPDATTDDLFLVFAATRAAGVRPHEGGPRRMLALLLDALRARP